jgi:hypothetical protein
MTNRAEGQRVRCRRTQVSFASELRFRLHVRLDATGRLISRSPHRIRHLGTGTVPPADASLIRQGVYAALRNHSELGLYAVSAAMNILICRDEVCRITLYLARGPRLKMRTSEQRDRAQWTLAASVPQAGIDYGACVGDHVIRLWRRSRDVGSGGEEYLSPEEIEAGSSVAVPLEPLHARDVALDGAGAVL